MKDISKDLIAASLAPMILMILKKGENYGYEIIQELKASSGNQLEVAEGTLYPVLKKMEEKGWVKASWKKADSGRERRYYKLSAKGREQLDDQVTQWNFINQLIQQLWEPKNSIFKPQ